MALLLNIDSAFAECSVTLSNNEEVIAHEKSAVQKDHASFIQPAIKKICSKHGIALSAVDAVSVINGPGSYTGLRVGLASAKGLCYALRKPLILINALDLIAFALQQTFNAGNNTLLCPMIDARRMEVFTALYNNQLMLVKNYAAVIVDASFINEERKFFNIIAGGNGCFKLKNFPGFGNIQFNYSGYSIYDQTIIAYKYFSTNNFSNPAYSEPFYIKPVYTR